MGAYWALREKPGPGSPTPETTRPETTAPAAPETQSPPAVPAIESAFAKFDRYIDRIENAPSRSAQAEAYAAFSQTLTTPERIAYATLVADSVGGAITVDTAAWMIRVVQGPLPPGPARAEVDRLLTEVRAKRPPSGRHLDFLLDPSAKALASPSPARAAPLEYNGPVHVRGYYRKDGTYVQPHTRSR